ncbi:hypothetical protein HDU97_004146 [Phlyctochytrium planicorne]|nr:hypothetical protein HDU97_004146 [Phlyctochytrium planicorne]
MRNMSITGPIPDFLGSMPELTDVRISDNKLEGPIPVSLLSLKLTTLDIYNNSLSGPLPKELGNVASLEYLRIQDNKFTGPIPSSFSALRKLSYANFANNSFSGDYSALADISELWTLHLEGNKFTTPISAKFLKSTSLEVLNLKNNEITGTIPDVGYVAIEQLRFSNNFLYGPVPAELYQSSTTKLQIDGNCFLDAEVSVDLFKNGKNMTWKTGDQSCYLFGKTVAIGKSNEQNVYVKVGLVINDAGSTVTVTKPEPSPTPVQPDPSPSSSPDPTPTEDPAMTTKTETTTFVSTASSSTSTFPFSSSKITSLTSTSTSRQSPQTNIGPTSSNAGSGEPSPASSFTTSGAFYAIIAVTTLLVFVAGVALLVWHQRKKRDEVQRKSPILTETSLGPGGQMPNPAQEVPAGQPFSHNQTSWNAQQYQSNASWTSAQYHAGYNLDKSQTHPIPLQAFNSTPHSISIPVAAPRGTSLAVGDNYGLPSYEEVEVKTDALVFPEKSSRVVDASYEGGGRGEYGKNGTLFPVQGRSSEIEQGFKRGQ